MEGFLSKTNEQLITNLVINELITHNPDTQISHIEPLVKESMEVVARENENIIGDIITANRLVIDRLFTKIIVDTEDTIPVSSQREVLEQHITKDTSLPSNMHGEYATYSHFSQTHDTSHDVITRSSEYTENELYVTFSSSLRVAPNETFLKFGVRFGSLQGHANGISFLDTPKLVIGAYVDKIIMPVNANIFTELPNVGPLIEVRLRGSNLTTRGHSSVDADLVLTTLAIRDHVTVFGNSGEHTDAVHGKDVRFISYHPTSPQSWSLPAPITVSNLDFELAFPELALAGITDYQDIDIGTVTTITQDTIILHVDPEDNLSVSNKYNVDERVLLYADERKPGTVLAIDENASTIEIEVCLDDHFSSKSISIINTSRQYYVQMRLRILENKPTWKDTSPLIQSNISSD